MFYFVFLRISCKNFIYVGIFWNKCLDFLFFFTFFTFFIYFSLLPFLHYNYHAHFFKTSTKFGQKLRELNKGKQDHTGHTGPQNHTRPYGTIWDHTGPYMTIQYHMGIYGTKQDHTKQYRTTQGHMGPYGTKMDRTGLYGTIWDNAGPYGTIQYNTVPYGTYRTIQNHRDPARPNGTIHTLRYHTVP